MSEAAWVLGPTVGRDDGPRLCGQLADRLRDRPATAPYTVDISLVAVPDMGTVEALARLQLTARRLGHRLCFRADGNGQRFRELLALTGLEAVLPLDLVDRGSRGAGLEAPL